MHVVVDEIARKYARLTIGLEHPPTVVGRFAWSHIDDAKGTAPDGDALAVPHPFRWERARRCPFVSEHGPKDALFVRIVPADGIRYATNRIYLDVEAAHERRDRPVMIRMRVRDDHAGERLARLVNACAKAPNVRHAESHIGRDNL